MRKLIMLLLLVVTLSVGCISSPNVDKTEIIQGEKIKILKDSGKTVRDNGTDDIYVVELDSIAMLEEGYYGFYLHDDSILILQNRSDYSKENGLQYTLEGKIKNSESDNFENYYLDCSLSKYYEDEDLADNIKSMRIQLSPDRQKVMHVLSSWRYFISNLPPVDLLDSILHNYSYSFVLRDSLNRNHKIVPKSITWIDDNRIGISNVSGDITVYNYNDPNKSLNLSLDSIYKTKISYIDNNVVYIKNIGLQQKDTEGPNYDWVQSQDNVNHLSFSKDSNMIDQIIETSEDLNIKNYEISPDSKYIAMYFENKDGEGTFYISDIDGKLFTTNITRRDMIPVLGADLFTTKTTERAGRQLLDDKVIDMEWSEDSTKLAVSTEGKIPSLFIVTIEKTKTTEKESVSVYKSPIVTNKKLNNLHWNKEGDSILAVEEKEEKGYVYEIKLK